MAAYWQSGLGVIGSKVCAKKKTPLQATNGLPPTSLHDMTVLQPLLFPTLLSLYRTLVRPILEYGAVVWDPPSNTVSHLLKITQLFALKLSSKTCSADYSSLLSKFNLTILQHRSNKAKLIFIFKQKFSLSCYQLSSQSTASLSLPHPLLLS